MKLNHKSNSHILPRKFALALEIVNLKSIFRIYKGLAYALWNLNPVVLKKSLRYHGHNINSYYDCHLIRVSDIDLDAIIPATMDVYKCIMSEAIKKIKQRLGIGRYHVSVDFRSWAGTNARVEGQNNHQAKTAEYCDFRQELFFQPICFQGEEYFPYSVSPLPIDMNEHTGIIVYQGRISKQCYTVPFSELQKNDIKETYYHENPYFRNQLESVFLLGADSSNFLPISSERIKNTDKPVIFCVDPLLARQLTFRLEDSVSMRGQVHVTTLYGSLDYLDKANFSCLEDRDVIIIPNLNLTTADYKKLCTQIEAVDARSIKILQYPIVPFSENKEEIDINSFSKVELYIHDTFKSLKEFDEIAKCYSTIMADALDADMALNLFANLLKDADNETVKESFGMPLQNLMMMEFPKTQRVLLTFINSKYFTVIVAPSDSGKSYFCRCLFIAITTGNGFLMFNKSESVKALFVDIENTREDVHKSFAQILDANGESDFSKIKLSLLTNEDLGIFNFETEAGYESFLDNILKEQYKVIGFDNFFTLIQCKKSVEKALDLFISFAQRLRENGVAVVLVHHTGHDEHKAFGSSKFNSLLQNVIIVHKPEKIDDFASKLPSDTLQKYSNLAKNGERFSLVSFDKIKGHDELRNSVSILYYSKENRCWDNYIPNENNLSEQVAGDLALNIGAESTVYADDHNLLLLLQKVDEVIPSKFKETSQTILKSLYNLQNGQIETDRFSKKDICSGLPQATSKSIIDECFQELQKQGLLESEGETSNKKYMVPHNTFQHAEIKE